MARPRTPTNVLDARGAFKKNPNRRREDPDVDAEIGEPPAFFDEAHACVWQELVAAAPNGVLKGSDRVALEMACRLTVAMRTNAEFPISGMLRLEALLGKFGMTPADRSKVSGTKKKSNNAFDQF